MGFSFFLFNKLHLMLQAYGLITQHEPLAHDLKVI